MITQAQTAQAVDIKVFEIVKGIVSEKEITQKCNKLKLHEKMNALEVDALLK